MQRYSETLPWVTVERARDGTFYVNCDVCGAPGEGLSIEDVHRYAAAHRAHTAPRGTFGIGDAVHAVAGPIAKAFGKAPCTPCEARRHAMNRFRWPF